MKYIFTILLLLGFQNIILGQSAMDTTWNEFGKVTFTKVHDKFLNIQIEVPIFTEYIKKLNGKVIHLEGFIIYENENKTSIVLAKNADTLLFFCGHLSVDPTQIVQLNIAMPSPSLLSRRVKVRGRLVLNRANIEQLIYQMNEVEITSQ